jgi:hypothetical protein
MRFVEIAKFVAEATVAPPTNLKAAMESAGVRLTWDPSPTIEPRAPVTGYNIYRRKADEADYKKVGSTTVGEAKPDTEPVGPEGQPSPEAAQAKAGRSYLDNSIEFDAKYSYTVRAVAAKAKPPESDPSTAAEIEVPRDVEFFVKTVSAKNASIKVWKLANKEWKSRTYMAVYPGESIGAVYATPARGGKPAETVDYRTGATLVDFDASAARQKKLILSKPVRDERGVMVNIDEIRLVPDIYKGKIVYLDKRGELKEKWMGKEELEEVYKRFPGLGVPAAAAPKPAAPEGGAPPPPPGEEKKGPQELKPE